MINVLVVEDSSTALEFLIHILSRDPDLQVVGVARDGREALEAVQRTRPDVITMDINMPRMNGFEATRRIMETCPTPIVIVSGSWEPGEVETSFRAMQAGAQAVLARPRGIGHPEFEAAARELVQTVKLMSEVKVIRRWARARDEATPLSLPPAAPPRTSVAPRVVALGASTGGPVALRTILSHLPQHFPVPVLLVQHMAAGFIHGFATWLAQTTPLPIHVASRGAALLPGHVYVAPDDHHMGVTGAGTIALSQEPPEEGARPAVAYLFRSVARVFGTQAVAVLLTGMGKDGAAALHALHGIGAVTIAQDATSSVVHGMPGEAIRLNAATYVLPPIGIAHVLINLVTRQDGHDARP